MLRAAIRARSLFREQNAVMLLAGLVSVAFGVIIAARPGAGALGILWVIGFYAIVFGVLLLILAFRVRKVAGKLV